MASDDGLVLLSVDDAVATLTLNRPEAMNAMNAALADQLRIGIERIENDPDIRVGIITGNGRAFCAGADLKERASGGDSGRGWHDVAGFIQRHPDAGWTAKPIIAAINGFALAGGLELALRCDILVASTDAQFGLPEIKHGFFAGGGGPPRLPRAIPRALAMEMILTGEPIDAATALRAGLVSRVVLPDQLLPTVRAIAERIASYNPIAVRATREVAYASDDMSLPQALRLGGALRWIVGQSDAAKTGAQAWVGRKS
ncbi:MAG: enoyl-CoA hydratase/isomerase family protein [Dehalococcoidia bacterium]|nr:MAG: enoyl-CoA hydratase/isomerase family protein [Dehalococcoidia bacterium]